MPFQFELYRSWIWIFSGFFEKTRMKNRKIVNLSTWFSDFLIVYRISSGVDEPVYFFMGANRDLTSEHRLRMVFRQALPWSKKTPRDAGGSSFCLGTNRAEEQPKEKDFLGGNADEGYDIANSAGSRFYGMICRGFYLSKIFSFVISIFSFFNQFLSFKFRFILNRCIMNNVK